MQILGICIWGIEFLLSGHFYTSSSVFSFPSIRWWIASAVSDKSREKWARTKYWLTRYKLFLAHYCITPSEFYFCSIDFLVHILLLHLSLIIHIFNLSQKLPPWRYYMSGFYISPLRICIMPEGIMFRIQWKEIFQCLRFFFFDWLNFNPLK